MWVLYFIFNFVNFILFVFFALGLYHIFCDIVCDIVCITIQEFILLYVLIYKAQTQNIQNIAEMSFYHDKGNNMLLP